MRRLLVLTLLFALLPSAARAAWQPAQPMDGPNGLVVGLGGVSVARDGGGAAAYIRRDGVFVSRLAGGAVGGPEQGAATGTATEAAVAAGDGNRLLVALIDGGSVFAAVAAGG